IKAFILFNILLMPFISYIFKKARKAIYTLALNSIIIINKIRHLKEKNLKRQKHLS
ncbi:hypothetical protein BBK36DRAFT_1131264, partial [Trichoderma citrinoviride]